MFHYKILLLGCFFANSLPLVAQLNPGLRDEIGIAPFALEWNNETLNEPIAPKGFYRGFYNRHFYRFVWTNSIGYGKNNIKDRSQGCFDCFSGTGRMKELIATSGWRLRFPTKSSSPFKAYIEAGGYYADYNYRGEFEGGPSGQGIVLNLSSQTLGAYGELGLTYSPVPRISIFASTRYKQGKDFFGERKVKTFGLTLIQLGVGFFPFNKHYSFY